MNYKKIYDNLISNRKHNTILEGYTEVHHITPRSIGGDDSKDNLVKLTAREHYIAHALLAEIYEKESHEWYKMNHAFMMMKLDNKNRASRYYNSRYYELKRKDFSKVMSHSQSGKGNSQYGKVWVTDGVNSKFINKLELDDYLKLNWFPGRVITKKITKKNPDLERKRKELRKGLASLKRKLKKNKLDSEKRKLKEYEKKQYSYNSIYLNLLRRNNLNNMFGFDLNGEFDSSMEKIKKILYEDYVIHKKSTIDLAIKYNSSPIQMCHYLDIFGIARRTLSESNKLYKSKIKQKHSQ